MVKLNILCFTISGWTARGLHRRPAGHKTDRYRQKEKQGWNQHQTIPGDTSNVIINCSGINIKPFQVIHLMSLLIVVESTSNHSR